LPQFLLYENKLRRTNHWIILGFFFTCCSIVGITLGDIEILAGVYTISFLGVMALFATGNMLLKVKRRRLPRAVKASWPGVVFALVAVLVGLAANALIDYPHLVRVRVFVVYFAVAVALVSLTFARAKILKVMLAALRGIIEPINQALMRKLGEVNRQRVVFFTKGDNRANLNRAALYVLENEQTRRLKVVHVYEQEEDLANVQLAEQLRTIDELYPELRIDLVLVQGKFGPELIERLSRRMNVPKNYMVLGTPGDQFPHNIAELGGVRLII
jgi:4-amino-4-deoxy-L-arabinose transferase-like glycosyltransferase